MKDPISAHDKEAREYDRQVVEYEYFAPDVLFGMCYEYIKPGESLLDIGTGTGLGALPFANAGLKIYGLDGSREMLKVCEAKGFAVELTQHDMMKSPYPYPDGFFSHVISCGVFHFFGDLEPVVREVSRLIGAGGIFGFNVAEPPSTPQKTGLPSPAPGYGCIDTPWGVEIFVHGKVHLTGLLQNHGFEMLKRQKLLMRGGPGTEEDMTFTTYVSRKASSR